MLKLRGRHGVQAMANFLKCGFSRDSDRTDSVRITNHVQKSIIDGGFISPGYDGRHRAGEDPLASTLPGKSRDNISRCVSVNPPSGNNSINTKRGPPPLLLLRFLWRSPALAGALAPPPGPEAPGPKSHHRTCYF